MDLTVAHNRDVLTSRAADGRFGNAFTLRIENRDRVEREFAIGLAEPGFELVAGVNPLRVAATSALETRVFVLAAEPVAEGASLTFLLDRSGKGGGRVARSARFLTPGGDHAHRGR
jgi:FixG-like putative oxidoreductase